MVCTAAAQDAIRWGAPEIVALPGAQRERILALLAPDIGSPFVHDPQALRARCQRAREATDLRLRCALLFHRGRAHYLVEPEAQPAADQSGRYTAYYAIPSFLAVLEQALMRHIEAAVKADRDPGESFRSGAVRYRDPQVDAVARELARAVAPNRAPLVATMLQAADAEVRSTAAFLLQWSGDAQTTIRAGMAAFDDPDASVRNNFSRLASLAAPALPRTLQNELALRWCAQLALPTYTDRNKATAGLAALPDVVLSGLPPQCVQALRDFERATAIKEQRRQVHKVLRAAQRAETAHR